ncbi:MAG: adenylosuccinate synthetase, partial [Rhodothermales bacterium]|nr:adenylosuccinate synthetase [Rhodothermales bacterium]
PFPTELLDDSGDQLRTVGREFGATTGRPRRCGWLDLVALRYTSMINGFTELAITKLDVLTGMSEIKACVAYEIDGKETERFHSEVETLEQARPIYRGFEGWSDDITGAVGYEDLPDAARKYLEFVSSFLRVPIRMISTGPKREQTIVIDRPTVVSSV